MFVFRFAICNFPWHERDEARTLCKSMIQKLEHIYGTGRDHSHLAAVVHGQGLIRGIQVRFCTITVF